jgi:hypothetical protein
MWRWDIMQDAGAVAGPILMFLAPSLLDIKLGIRRGAQQLPGLEIFL